MSKAELKGAFTATLISQKSIQPASNLVVIEALKGDEGEWVKQAAINACLL